MSVEGPAMRDMYVDLSE